MVGHLGRGWPRRGGDALQPVAVDIPGPEAKHADETPRCNRPIVDASVTETGTIVWTTARERPRHRAKICFSKLPGVRGVASFKKVFNVADQSRSDQETAPSGAPDLSCPPLRRLAVGSETLMELFRCLPVAVLVSTIEGEVLDLNRAMMDLLATDAESMIGVKPSDMPLGDSRSALEEALFELRQRPQLTREIRFMRHGQAFWGLARFMRVSAHGNSSFVVMNIEDLTERRHIEEQLAVAARIDPFTGLANRTAIMERLEDALSSAGDDVVMVAFCDIDSLKEVNDRCGHQAGDHLLLETAKRLQSACQVYDTVGRLSGDEFVIVGLRATQAEAEDQVSSLLAALRPPLDVGGHRVGISASIGLAVGGGDRSGAALLRAADEAMYRAKRQGAGRWRLANGSDTPDWPAGVHRGWGRDMSQP